MLALCDVFAGSQVQDHDGVAASWVLPFCLIFVAQKLLALVARRESFEAQAK